METIKKTYLYFLTLLLLLMVGCSKDENGMNTENMQPLLITPADNSIGIRLDADIEMNFARAVDPKIVERNFHLISEKDVADSTCPFGMNMMHGNMNMVMMDSMKMNHLDEYHRTPGKFTWNSDLTNCVFTPDSMMTPNMQYMMHFGKEMINMMQQRMGDMMEGGMMMNGKNGMSGMGSGQMSGHMMQHFLTMDTTKTRNGHNGHH